LKPGSLPFSKISGVLLYFIHRRFAAENALHGFEYLLIANRFQGI
jgi:hypothetical protein